MIRILNLLRNKKVQGLLELLLVLCLWWFFYSRSAPGFYVLTAIAAIFWRDPLIEAITGKSTLDLAIFDMRLGQIIYSILAVAYFIAIFVLLAFIAWKAVKNILSRE
ncbi:hypothetical protein ACFL37_01705 [Candidatus Margulisiibacteriota bacterium]